MFYVNMKLQVEGFCGVVKGIKWRVDRFQSKDANLNVKQVFPYLKKNVLKWNRAEQWKTHLQDRQITWP